MRPFDGSAVLELNPSLVFPILEMLLGGSGRSAVKVEREVTEIEQSILESLLRIILHDLKEAWMAVTAIGFVIEEFETEPQLLQILAPNEAIVAISMEVRIGESSGMMNIGMPSIIIKMLRQKFDQQWSIRKTESTDAEQERILQLIKSAEVQLDVRMRGPSMSVGTLMALKEGDILTFDFPTRREMDMMVNGKLKYRGQVAAAGRKKAFEVAALAHEIG